jgi:Rrf2 family protein
MKRDGRLSASLHVLAHLAEAADRPVTSGRLAACLDTNPVVVRRTLASLRAAGIVTSTKGHGGGWTLARAPASISLGEVALALGGADLAGLRPPPANPACLIEASVTRALDDFYREAEALLLRRLGAISLADLAADVRRRRAGAAEPSPSAAI